MSDILICFCGADRSVAAKLGAAFEAEGLSVAGERAPEAAAVEPSKFDRRMEGAGAVVVLFSAASVKSGALWSNAAQAMAKNKLVAVHSGGVLPADIPAPFRDMRVEAVERLDLIKAALGELLANRLQPPLNFGARLTCLFASALTWLGVAGLTIELFGACQGYVRLSDWASWLLVQWAATTHAGWSWLLAALDSEAPRSFTLLATALTLMACVVAGVRMTMRLACRRERARAALEQPEYSLKDPMVLACILLGLLPLPYIAVSLAGDQLPGEVVQLLSGANRFTFELAIVALLIIPFRCRDMLSAVIVAWLTMPVFILLSGDLIRIGGWVLAEAQSEFGLWDFLRNGRRMTRLWDVMLFSWLFFCALALSQISARRLKGRLVVMLAGLGLLLAANEITKFNLGVYLNSMAEASVDAGGSSGKTAVQPPAAEGQTAK